MATTHYSELKIYAMTTAGVQNACCEFDIETLRPTYKLLVGIPGKSNAFAISEKLGLSRDVINKAKDFISQENIQFEDLLSDIEKNRIKAEREKEQAETYKQQIEAMRLEASKERERITNERDRIIAKAKEEARSMIIEARSEAEELLEKLKTIQREGFGRNSEKELQDARADVRRLDHLESSYVESYNVKSYIEPPKELKPGESVLIMNVNQKATVLEEPDPEGQVLVQAGIMKVKIHVSQLKRMDEQKDVVEKMHQVHLSNVKASPVKLELDLRGLNVEETLDKVDKYIDDAVIAGLHEVTLIHGKGTGTLRKAVQDHLRRHPHVEASRLGKYGEGETGVTVVTLR